ncbi:MAG: primase-helicase zinc-binding domain-containing protein, partial [Legionella sp.]
MTSKAQASQQTMPITTFSQHNYTAKEVIKKAEGYWPYILENLGIEASYLKNKHGPCPVCGGKDRFRFDNKAGTGSFFCNHCGAGRAIKLLMLFHQWSFKLAIEAVAKILNINAGSYSTASIHISNHLKKAFENNGLLALANESINKQRKKLKKIWNQSLSVSSDDPVSRYLKARGVLPNDVPKVLRFHPQLAYYDGDSVFIGNFPAMLALVQNENNELITLHRTYLGDSCKADVKSPKKLMSAIFEGATRGAAIKLYEPVDGKLILAEGIETALAL